MAVTYANDVKSDRMSAVITQIGAAGVLEILDTNGTTVLASIALANPAGTVTGANTDTLTFTMPQSDSSADATGTATTARITDGTNNVITGLTVSTVAAGTGDIQLDSTSITATQTVTLNSASITHG